MSETVRDLIEVELGKLDYGGQLQVLDFARSLLSPAGAPGQTLLSLAGKIDPADLALISSAIEEGCDRLESNAR
jgi:hypothetical protein